MCKYASPILENIDAMQLWYPNVHRKCRWDFKCFPLPHIIVCKTMNKHWSAQPLPTQKPMERSGYQHPPPWQQEELPWTCWACALYPNRGTVDNQPWNHQYNPSNKRKISWIDCLCRQPTLSRFVFKISSNSIGKLWNMCFDVLSIFSMTAFLPPWYLAIRNRNSIQVMDPVLDLPCRDKTVPS